MERTDLIVRPQRRYCICRRYRGVFPHRPLRALAGSIRFGHSAALFDEIFQSTPPRGGDKILKIQVKKYVCFNPRPREGGDHMARELGVHFLGFNPRPREGGDRLRRPY